jgi:Putative zinc-finger
MNCAEWEERIALHAGRDLAASEAAVVDLHLAACAECRGFHEGLRQSMDVLLEAHREPIDAAHFAAVRARVMARIPAQPRWRWAWLGGLAAAAAVVLLALALRPVRVPEPPRVAVRIPPAAVIRRAGESPAPPALPALRRARPVRRAVGREPRPPLERAAPRPAVRPEQPLVVKLITNDPNVVIYWIAD